MNVCGFVCRGLFDLWPLATCGGGEERSAVLLLLHLKT